MQKADKQTAQQATAWNMTKQMWQEAGFKGFYKVRAHFTSLSVLVRALLSISLKPGLVNILI